MTEQKPGTCPVCEELMLAAEAGTVKLYEFQMSGHFYAEPGKEDDVLAEAAGEIHGASITWITSEAHDTSA